MRNFQDSSGQTWGVRVDRAALRRVKAETGVLLTDIGANEFALLNQICSDTLLAGDILWVLCQEQASNRSVSKDEFERLTDGEHFESAVHAVLEAIADFFPKPQKGLLMKMFEEGKKMAAKQAPLLEKLIEMEAAGVQANLEKRINELTRSLSTPDSPAS